MSNYPGLDTINTVTPCYTSLPEMFVVVVTTAHNPVFTLSTHHPVNFLCKL